MTGYHQQLAKQAAAPFGLRNAAETLTKTVISALAKKDCLPKKLHILWLAETIQKPLARVTFPHLDHHEEADGWMDATLATPWN